MDYVTTKEMRILEENSEYLGVKRMFLMENAGASLARIISENVKPQSRLLFLCGLGNNGGDGMVAARHLAGKYRVTVYLLGGENSIRTEEAAYNWKVLRCLKSTVKLELFRGLQDLKRLKEAIYESDTIVDAIFGTGLKGDVRSPIREVIGLVNESKKNVIAVDVPSGLNPDTGQIHGIAVKATHTVTFHKAKRGLLEPKAKEFVGKLYIVPIGIPEEAGVICGPGDLKVVHRTRDPWSKKGDYGRILIVGGSKEFSGAPVLSALASLRAGADLAIILSPEPASLAQKGMSPNIISVPLEGDYINERHLEIIEKYSERSDVVVLGPGMGLRDETAEALRRMLERLTRKNVKLVLDADALKPLKDVSIKFGYKAVLTPHAGEFKAVTGIDLPCEIEERSKAVRELARKVEAVVLLKGHEDVISNGERVRINRTGNPGMTAGGTGDVLTGVVATFMAWSDDPLEAACAAAFINGIAGDMVSSEKGYHLLATDLIEKLPAAIEMGLSGKLSATQP